MATKEETKAAKLAALNKAKKVDPMDALVEGALKEFKEKMGREARVSPKQIATWLEQSGIGVEDWTTQEVVAQVIPELEPDDGTEADDADTDNTGRSTIKSISEISEQIRKLGEKANKDEELKKHIQQRVSGDMLKKRLPGIIALDLMRIYTKEELAEFAVPGLDRADMQPGDNRKPDVEKKGEGSWYQDFATTMDDFQPIAADLKSLEGKSGPGVKADKSMHQGRKASFIDAVRGAMKIIFGMWELRDKTDLVADLRTVNEEGKELDRHTVFIRVKRQDGKGDSYYVSYGQFLQIVQPEHLKKIANSDDQMKNLYPERKPRLDKNKQPVYVKTVEQGVDAIVEFSLAIDDAKFDTNIKEKLDSQSDVGDETYMSGYKLYRWLDRYYSRPTNIERSKTLTAKAEAEAAKEAADKAKKAA